MINSLNALHLEKKVLYMVAIQIEIQQLLFLLEKEPNISVFLFYDNFIKNMTLRQKKVLYMVAIEIRIQQSLSFYKKGQTYQCFLMIITLKTLHSDKKKRHSSELQHISR